MYVFERFLRNTFSTDISRRGGSALYRDSKEQYNADCLANRDRAVPSSRHLLVGPKTRSICSLLVTLHVKKLTHNQLLDM